MGAKWDGERWVVPTEREGELRRLLEDVGRPVEWKTRLPSHGVQAPQAGAQGAAHPKRKPPTPKVKPYLSGADSG
jgi:hypothetical protein